MRWTEVAPSNIALIKYMGKENSVLNQPINASLSYTLPHLSTRVELVSSEEDVWAPMNQDGFVSPDLSPQGIQRFLKHLKKIKAYFKCEAHFIVSSGNNFPHGVGLASSASSFSALTQCAVRACCELTGQSLLDKADQAQLSREGSGSSCRSFFSPWALWDKIGVRAIDLPQTQLIHQVIMFRVLEKEVSSSHAHERIKTSPAYALRPKRAELRLNYLIDALQKEDWLKSYHICFDEFMDMHDLFHTSSPAFSYFTQETTQALDRLTAFWAEHQTGPLITMDAGPNIHLLYRPDQKDIADHLFRYFSENYDVLCV